MLVRPHQSFVFILEQGFYTFAMDWFGAGAGLILQNHIKLGRKVHIHFSEGTVYNVHQNHKVVCGPPKVQNTLSS